MSCVSIRGGNPLRGSVDISGSKNSALAIMVAAALADGECILENIPQQLDVLNMGIILRSLGVKVWFDQDSLFHVDGRSIDNHRPPYDLVRKMRASFYVTGLLLARTGKAEVPLPGGCAIGTRPVDYHIKGFQQMGAQIKIEHGYLKASTDKLEGTRYFINRASVGTTINLIIGACLAKGTTILENAAKEPEVVDTSILLNAMGAKIRGAGTDVIRIEGVNSLKGVRHSIIPDRLEAATFAMAVGAVGGEVYLRNVMPEHLRSPLSKIQEAGLTIEENDTTVFVAKDKPCVSIDVETAVYPGFPTDLQQPIVAMLTQADGTSVVRETIFDGRFRYVDELRRLGADIRVERDTAIVRGPMKLSGAPVEVTDLRAGASLVIAALAAQGNTELHNFEVVDRGYENIEQKLRELGADIVRVDDDNPDDIFKVLRSEASIDVAY
jgi:UDP-N-acetylglucosamine 1-carboxyvinyltransferase